ncbi:SDR family oxidoreductase [Rhodococcus sp. IEGM 1307]|uniref:SDR family NAD(P)-dependent oxidoreductase n=1 Tax=Rhodococcus sp. IEGM 1307 TaxID=3047091 RepID=UPI0024B7E856|nr:SDR family oxidoreductase [Rhodococcus sp. IEGM 1307]MDI9974164.1 SDR family oxidoreductase [Rhodococcus sp. IEGM 1307]
MGSYRLHPPQSGLAWEVADVKVLQQRLLAGTHAVVTGAGSGIGQGICVRLAELGAAVTGIGRTDSALQRTAELVARTQGNFQWFPADVRDCAQVRSVISEASAELGMDLLVNNAGGQFYAAADEISDKGFRSVVDLNLNAVFTVISEAKQFLARRGGSIINISLSGVERGSVGLTHSLAARAGVLAMTKTLALEWAHLGIRANCVAPGVVISDSLPGAIASDLRDRVVPESVPAGRPTPTADVAELVAFLATPAGRMITGQLLQIDGAAHLGRGLHMVDNWPPGEEGGE